MAMLRLVRVDITPRSYGIQLHLIIWTAVVDGSHAEARGNPLRFRIERAP